LHNQIKSLKKNTRRIGSAVVREEFKTPRNQ
jgi:hypothetical protein